MQSSRSMYTDLKRIDDSLINVVDAELLKEACLSDRNLYATTPTTIVVKTRKDGISLMSITFKKKNTPADGNHGIVYPYKQENCKTQFHAIFTVDESETYCDFYIEVRNLTNWKLAIYINHPGSNKFINAIQEIEPKTCLNIDYDASADEGPCTLRVATLKNEAGKATTVSQQIKEANQTGTDIDPESVLCFAVLPCDNTPPLKYLQNGFFSVASDIIDESVLEPANTNNSDTYCCINLPVIPHLNTDNNITDNGQRYGKYMERMVTFVDPTVHMHRWAYKSSPNSLAGNGFYYSGCRDRNIDHVTCFKCHGQVAGYAMGNNPAFTHDKMFPDCPLTKERGVNYVYPVMPDMHSYLHRSKTFSNHGLNSKRYDGMAKMGFISKNKEHIQCFGCGYITYVAPYTNLDDVVKQHQDKSPTCFLIPIINGNANIEKHCLHPNLYKALNPLSKSCCPKCQNRLNDPEGLELNISPFAAKECKFQAMKRQRTGDLSSGGLFGSQSTTNELTGHSFGSGLLGSLSTTNKSTGQSFGGFGQKSTTSESNGGCFGKAFNFGSKSTTNELKGQSFGVFHATQDFDSCSADCSDLFVGKPSSNSGSVGQASQFSGINMETQQNFQITQTNADANSVGSSLAGRMIPGSTNVEQLATYQSENMYIPADVVFCVSLALSSKITCSSDVPLHGTSNAIQSYCAKLISTKDGYIYDRDGQRVYIGDKEEDRMCSICLTEVANVIVTLCGHVPFCEDCYVQYRLDQLNQYSFKDYQDAYDKLQKNDPDLWASTSDTRLYMKCPLCRGYVNDCRQLCNKVTVMGKE